MIKYVYISVNAVLNVQQVIFEKMNRYKLHTYEGETIQKRA